MKPKVVFTGCARDCAKDLPGVLANIEAVSRELCAASACVFVENDSRDDTCALLDTWCAGRDNARVLHFPPGTIDHLPRTVRLAMARNRYLDALTDFPGYDYLMVFDLDEVNQAPLSLPAVQKAFDFLAAAPDRAAVFANSKGIYYDMWTLRHPVCPGDIWAELAEYRAAHPTESEEAAKRAVLAKKIISIPPDSPPVEVDSAFGGIGIYKIDRLVTSGARYHGYRLTTHDGVTRGWQRCCHVALNQTLKQAGGRLFIFPELLNWDYPKPFFLLASPSISFDPALLDLPPAAATASPRPEAVCRVCGGPGREVFTKRLLDRYEATYFQCESCGCLYSQPPAWLDAAFAQTNDRFDTGQVLRALDNAAFLMALIAANGGADMVLDYGCGSGLCVRLLRDAGVNAWGYDQYVAPRLCAGFRLDGIRPATIVNCCAVTERFAEPLAAMEAIFAAGPAITLVHAPLVDGKAPAGWCQIVPEHGQHVFYWSGKALEHVARRFGKKLLFFRNYFAFVADDPALIQRLEAVPLLRAPMPDIRNRFLQKLGTTEPAQAHLDLCRLWERHYLGDGGQD